MRKSSFALIDCGATLFTSGNLPHPFRMQLTRAMIKYCDFMIVQIEFDMPDWPYWVQVPPTVIHVAFQSFELFGTPDPRALSQTRRRTPIVVEWASTGRTSPSRLDRPG